MISVEQIKQLLGNNDEVEITISYESDVKLKGGKKNPLQGRVKKVVKNATGVIYSAPHYEKEVNKRLAEEGKKPNFKANERKWGKRVGNLPIIEHNGTYYLEVFFTDKGDVYYTVDDEKTNKDEIEGLPEYKGEGEQGGIENKIIIRTVKFDNITDLK